MKLLINEAAKLSGISVRTLHYYDEIGLLKPDYVDEQNGYRYYCDESLARLQQIMFYRELDFPLKKIAAVLSEPNNGKQRALECQRELLVLKKTRLDGLIALLDRIIKGEDEMSFKEFDTTEFDATVEKYASEVKERYGNTEAYAESQKKHAGLDENGKSDIMNEANAIMREFADCMNSGAAPESDEAQALVEKWREHICQRHYNCTKEILAGLGMMYIGDKRFTENIDRFSKGTAQFMSDSIAVYCR